MSIDYEKLHKFVRKHGDVRVLDTAGKTRKLSSGDPDVWDLVEKADKFLHNGKWYSRAEFEKIVGNLSLGHC